MAVQTSSDDRAGITTGGLWFGTAAAAVAWALQGLICELISAKACQNNIGSWGVLSPGGVKWVLATVTLIALGFGLSGGWESYRNWRRLNEHEDLIRAEGSSRVQFMALIGTVASLVFVVGILWAGIPLIMLDVCVKAR